MAEDLKLYVWEDVLTDYTCGAMFCLAASEEEARELLLEQDNHIPSADIEKQPSIYDPKTEKVAFVVWGG